MLRTKACTDCCQWYPAESIVNFCKRVQSELLCKAILGFCVNVVNGRTKAEVVC
jgi:hypothetical protein